jgi:hypothetical protein
MGGGSPGSGDRVFELDLGGEAVGIAADRQNRQMEARVAKVVRISARFSKSLVTRRFRPNQEKVRSTAQRRGAIAHCG